MRRVNHSTLGLQDRTRLFDGSARSKQQFYELNNSTQLGTRHYGGADLTFSLTPGF